MTGQPHGTFSGKVRITVTGGTFTAHARLVTWSYGGKVHWGGFVSTDTRARSVTVSQEAHPTIELGEGTFPFSATLRPATVGGLLALTGLGPSPMETGS